LVKGDFSSAIALAEKATTETGGQFDRRMYVYALGAASLAYGFLGLWDNAVKKGQDGLNAANNASEDSLISFTANFLSWVYSQKGDLRLAVEYNDLATQKARTLADTVWSRGFSSRISCQRGDIRRGIEMLTTLLPIGKAGHHAMTQLWVLTFLAEGYLLALDFSKATETAEEGLRVATECESKTYAGWLHRILGETALHTAQDQAVAHFEKAISIFNEIKAPNELALAYLGMGRLHKLRGEYAEARRYLADALEIFERLGTLIEPEKVRKELAELP
jgi:tetratricopeptide (TPR) repeat protein